jgi:dTMP kinase
MRGIIIAIEGIDGAGKSTQARRLAEWFVAQGHEVELSHEPTGGPWGRKLRESAATGRLSPQDELDYFLKDRAQHVAELIAPALAAGKVLILDRYYFSSMAYQGSRGFDPAEIRRLNEAIAPVPDLLLVLDVEVDAGLSRIRARGDTANEFEKRDSLQRCREIFLSLKDEHFVRIISSGGTLDEVASRIREVISQAGLASLTARA